MPSTRIAAVMIHTPEPAAALAWYQRAFPTGRRVTMGEPALEALRVGDVQLEFVPADERVAAGAAGTVVYWSVADVEPELQRLLAIGARLYRGPMAIEDEQAMCQLRDPWGNCLGIRGKAASAGAPSQPDGGVGPLTVTIRRAAVADALALSALAARTFAETFGADNTPEDLAAHLRSAYGVAQQSAEIADPDVITLLADAGDALVGFTQVRRAAAPACVTHARPIELHRFYLARAAHGRGVAAPLMRAARAAARELGGLHLWLGVWERNPRAVAFYVKSGFAKVGSHQFVVGSDRQTDWVYVGPLWTPAGDPA